jgi:hypothetical protein
MKTVLFYHIYLDDLGHWSSIANEQFSCAENSKLFEAADEMYITCVSNDYYKTKWFSLLANSYFKKAVIEEVRDPFDSDYEMLESYPNFTKNSVEGKNTEKYTHKKIYDMSQTEDMKILYFHARGITFSVRTLHEAKSGNTKWIYDNQYQKLTYLSRQFLNWASIENWEKMHKAIDTYDVASFNYQSNPIPHFSGNTWWTKSSYVRTLSDPSNITWWKNLQDSLPEDNPLKSGFSAADRFRDEFWINSNPDAKLYSLVDLKETENPLKNIIHREVYAEKIQNDISTVNEKPVEQESMFSINKSQNKRAFIVDDFYSDPYAVRAFAQQQEYIEGGFGRGFIGKRTVHQFLFPGLKTKFESILNMKITKWEEYGMNGRFQLNVAGEPKVYHCDSQRFAAMIFLTPDAPPSCGTSTFMHRKTRVHHNSSPRINEVFIGQNNLDGTIYDNVDKFGNVFNRLVIFDGGCIHAASEYFGETMNDARLWHMFFFDAENF